MYDLPGDTTIKSLIALLIERPRTKTKAIKNQNQNKNINSEDKNQK